MKKLFLVAFMMMTSIGLSFAGPGRCDVSAIQGRDIDLVERVITKLETSLAGKSDTVRNSTITKLQRFAVKYQNNSRMHCIIQEVIYRLQNPEEDFSDIFEIDGVVNNNWSTYKNDTFGFQINYPKDWIYEELSDRGIGFGRPESRMGGYEFAISIYEPSKFDQIIAGMGSQFQDRKEARSKVIVSGYIEATMVTIMDKHTNPQWISKTVYFEKNGKIFAIGDGANISNNDTFEIFYKSFRFIENTSSERTHLTFKAIEISIVLPATYSAQVDGKGGWILTSSAPDAHDQISLKTFEGTRYVDSDSKFGDVTIAYDATRRIWVASSNETTPSCGRAPCPVRSFVNEKGMTVFVGSGRWLTYIVPISSNELLILNSTGSGFTAPLEELIKSLELSTNGKGG